MSYWGRNWLICWLILLTVGLSGGARSYAVYAISEKAAGTAVNVSIYEDDATIDYYLQRLNDVLPDYSVSLDNVEKLFYHDIEHDDQIRVNILETSFIVRDLDDGDKHRISVFWAYSDGEDTNAGHNLFDVMLMAMNGDLIPDELISRWNDTWAVSNHILRWDDDIVFLGRELADDEELYRWMKIIGSVG